MKQGKFRNWLKQYFFKLIDEYYFHKREYYRKRFKKIGGNVVIQEPCIFTDYENIVIGNNVSFAAFVHIWGGGGVEIGNDVMIASHTAITSITHNKHNKKFNSENLYGKVLIGNNVWIGAHVVIAPGVKIGDNCIIGACSYVNKDIPSNSVYVGIPAKPIGN